MNATVSRGLETLGEFSWLLLSIVAVHAAVQVRKYQDAYPTGGVERVLRGVLATIWFGVGSVLVQMLALSEPHDQLILPVGACVAAYLAVSYCPNDALYKVAQTGPVNAILVLGLEICRALCVGVGVSSTLRAYPGNSILPGMMGVVRGTWGWLLGRPGAKVILGRSIGDMSWPTPPLSAPASLVAAVLLVLADNRSTAETIIAALIAVLVSWRSYEFYTT